MAHTLGTALLAVLVVAATAGVASAGTCAQSVQNCATNQCQANDDTVCEQCVSNSYYLSSGTCTLCNSGPSAVSDCATCSSAGACLSCASSYYLESASSCAACTVCSGGLVQEHACNATANTVCRDGLFTSGRVQLKVIGQSGKFDLIPEDDQGVAQTSKKLRIEMDSLYELDASGAKIGTSGPQSGKHSKNTFATEEFAITGPNATTYGGIECRQITFSVDILGATLVMDTYLFTEDGTLTLGANSSVTEETFTIRPGTVKFNVWIDNWPFCAGSGGNPCNGATGSDLELTIKVTGPNSGSQSSSNSDEYDFGEGASMQLSNLFEIGGVYEEAGSGDVTFASDDLVLRFPKPTGSSKTMKYDPVFSFTFSNAASTTVPAMMAAVVLAIVSFATSGFH